MKRAELSAWMAAGGLIIIGSILLAGGVMYGIAAFWAGTAVAFAQAVVAGLAAWGLMLARQREELQDMPAMGSVQRPQDVRMTLADGAAPQQAPTETELKTLETGFQRLVVGIMAVVLMILSAIIGYFVIWNNVAWSRANPDKPFPIAGAFDKPLAVDELGLVIGLSAAALYCVLYSLTRVRRDTVGTGEAVNSNFAMGLGGMVSLGIATLLAYFKFPYASEAAAGIMAALLLLQGVELLVNAMRSYSGIEEFDQEAVDLQSLPLVPMLSSSWLDTLKMLFVQSFGLSGRTGGERGVISRMMPRAIVAFIIIGILVSCFRVVRPGEQAVLERLGYTEMSADGKEVTLLQPGLHILMPWPIDELVRIPTSALQETEVGAELHAPPGQTKVDFQFWMVRGEETPEVENASQFVTGDAGSPQILETYVKILWRVADPAKFYNGLSHSDFYQKGGEAGGTKALPVYEALIQESASFAVTRTFAIHSLDQIMISDRQEVERHCKKILQDKLNDAGSGIEVADLTIADLHPPYAYKDQPDYTSPDQVKRGPASAYENVVSMREYKEMVKDMATGYREAMRNVAKGEAAGAISQAKSYQFNKVATAEGEAARMTTMMQPWNTSNQNTPEFMERLAKTQTMYNSLKDAFAPIQKIVIDPTVKDVTLYQTTDKGMMQLRPPGS